MFNDFLNVFQN